MQFIWSLFFSFQTIYFMLRGLTVQDSKVHHWQHCGVWRIPEYCYIIIIKPTQSSDTSPDKTGTKGWQKDQRSCQNVKMLDNWNALCVLNPKLTWVLARIWSGYRRDLDRTTLNTLQPAQVILITIKHQKHFKIQKLCHRKWEGPWWNQVWRVWWWDALHHGK